MRRPIIPIAILALLPSAVFADVTNFRISPENPTSADNILLLFDTLYDLPVNGTLRIVVTGNVIQVSTVVTSGISPPPGNIIGTVALEIGSFPPGEYELRYTVFGPGVGQSTTGVIIFSVTPAAIPTLSRWALLLLLLLIGTTAMAVLGRAGSSR